MMRVSDKKNALLLGCGLMTMTVAELSTLAPANAETVEWQMHIVWVDARPEAQSYISFADKVREKTDGRFDIDVYTGGAMGIDDQDLLRQLPRGRGFQAAGLYPGYMTRDEPQYAYTLPPGVVEEPETLVELLPELREIYEETYDEWGIRLLGFVSHPVRDTHIMCNEPVDSLDDLRERRLRVWERFHVEAFDALDVSAQVIGQNDLYVAMQTGVVDCAVYPIGFSTTVSLHEVAPYASYLFPYVLHPLNLIVSEEAYQQLPEEYQQVLYEAAEEVQEESLSLYLSGEYDDDQVEVHKEGGGVLLDPFPEEDRITFRDTAREIWDEMTAEAGDIARANYERLNEALQEIEE